MMGFDMRRTPHYGRPGMCLAHRSGALLVVCLLSGAAAFAQEEPAGPPPAPPLGEAFRLGEVDASKLSIVDKRTRSEEMLAEERSALGRGTELLQEARAAKDIVQMNCVSEKLTQIKGLLKLTEQASVRMYEAIASYTEDVINHEFTTIWVAHQKSMLLKSEAEQCVGELSVFTGDTEVEVLVDGTDDHDPTEPEPPPPGPAVPPVASGF